MTEIMYYLCISSTLHKITQLFMSTIPLPSNCYFENDWLTKSFALHTSNNCSEKKNSPLIMRTLGYFGIPEPNAQIGSFNSPWKQRATKQMPKEKEMLGVLWWGVNARTLVPSGTFALWSQCQQKCTSAL